MKRSLAAGQAGERLLLSRLTGAGLECGLNTGARHSHDLWFRLGGRRWLVECKFDFAAARTGNLALEFWNTRQWQPSGLWRTRADLWCHLVPEAGREQVFLARVADLRAWHGQDMGDVRDGGDDNSRMSLYPRARLEGAVLFPARPGALLSLLGYLTRA